MGPKADVRLEEDVLRFEITMDQSCVLEDRQTFQQLLSKDLDQLDTETLELVLLDQLVQIRREAFEDQAEMAFVGERVVHPEDVVLVPWVVGIVELDSSARLLDASALQMGD